MLLHATDSGSFQSLSLLVHFCQSSPLVTHDSSRMTQTLHLTMPSWFDSGTLFSNGRPRLLVTASPSNYHTCHSCSGTSGPAPLFSSASSWPRRSSSHASGRLFSWSAWLVFLGQSLAGSPLPSSWRSVLSFVSLQRTKLTLDAVP